MAKNKMGRMTLDIQNYILKNYSVKTVKELAKETGYSERGVKRLLTRLGVTQETKQDDEAKLELYRKPYWKEIQNQLLEEEIDSFVSKWTAIMKQFNFDVLPSEELQINRLIILEILRGRAVSQQTDCLRESKVIQQELLKERKKKGQRSDLLKMNELENKLLQLQNNSSSFLKQHAELSKESEKLFTQLKASRGDRIKVIRDGSKSFAQALSLLEDEDVRKHMGREIHLMNLSQQRAKMKLMMAREFIDKKIDFPMLSWETMEFNEELEKVQESEEKNES